jgi:hypothetical protein
MIMHVLQKELDYFEAHLEEWLELYPGKIALVKHEELVGVFDSIDDAVDEGLRRYRGANFLARRIVREQPRHMILHAATGGRRADPARSCR